MKYIMFPFWFFYISAKKVKMKETIIPIWITAISVFSYFVAMFLFRYFAVVGVSVKVFSNYSVFVSADDPFNDVLSDLDFKLTSAVWFFAN